MVMAGRNFCPTVAVINARARELSREFRRGLDLYARMFLTDCAFFKFLRYLFRVSLVQATFGKAGVQFDSEKVNM